MAADVTITVYEIDGKLYRLANSADIGDECCFTDRPNWESVTSAGIFCIDVLHEILDEGEPHPYVDNDGVAWRKAYVYLGEIDGVAGCESNGGLPPVGTRLVGR